MNRVNDSKNLIGYWKFNGNTKDLSGRSNNGAWTGTEAYTTNANGKGVASFSGTNYVVIGTGLNTYLATNQKFSVALKFKATTSATTTALFANLDASSPEIGFSVNLLTDGYIKIYLVQTVTGNKYISKTTTATYRDNVEHQVVVTYDGAYAATGLVIYVDGVLVATTTEMNGIDGTATSSTTLQIGAKDGANLPFVGTIGDCSLYNLVLTQNEIISLYKKSSQTMSSLIKPKDTLPDVSDATLKGAWLNKATVGTTNDYSLNAKNLTNLGVAHEKVGATFSDGKYLSLSDDNDLDFSTGDYAISFWIKAPFSGATSYDGIVQKGQSSSAPAKGWGFLRNGGDTLSIAWYESSAGGGSYANYLTATMRTGWNHVAVTRNSATPLTTVYLNGTSLTTHAGLNDLSNTGVFRIGGSGDVVVRSFIGSIKDVRIYKGRYFTASEVTSLYNSNVPEPSLVFETNDGIKDTSQYDKAITLTSAVIAGKGITLPGNDTATFSTTGMSVTNGTVALEVTPTTIDATARYLFYHYNTGNRIYIVHSATTGNLYAILGSSGSAATSTSPIKATKTSHIVLTWNNGAGVLYHDGVQVAQVNYVDLTTLSASAALGFSSSIGFIGKIHNARVYNVAKSADWIKQDYEKAIRFW